MIVYSISRRFNLIISYIVTYTNWLCAILQNIRIIITKNGIHEVSSMQVVIISLVATPVALGAPTVIPGVALNRRE